METGLIRRYIGDLFPDRYWYILMGMCVLLFVISFFIPFLFEAAVIVTLLSLVLTVVDYVLLFLVKGTVQGNRSMAQRFSLGDDNRIAITLYNSYPFRVKAAVIDELPPQFQCRDFLKKKTIPYNGSETIVYSLRPLTRGEYSFGNLWCYARSPLRLICRRICADKEAAIKVYPSFLQLKKYQLMAVSDNRQFGVKKVRRVGHSFEFEKIKDYVIGDDVRTINWKATARRDALMVNMFTDARQQQIYALVDKGRSMKMPFEGMTLLDYSINAALAFLNIALMKQDRAGLITFSSKVNEVIAADRRSGQLSHLLEALYKQQTDFRESDYEQVWSVVHKKITHRSFLLLFTNFETIASLERQLPYLQKIASRHLLCVIFFENTLLKEIHESQPDSIEGIYIKTIADRFSYEKKQIVKELRRHGILSVLTTPQSLSIDVINKYLELKARQMI